MSGLYMMATISDRNQARRFLDFYREYGLSVTLLTYGRGTAASEILDAFGLEAAEKAVVFSVVTGEEWKRLKTGLERQIKIDIPGSGIAFIVPVSSIGGKKQFEFLTDGRGFVKGEESTLKDTKYELLVVIANQGYTELVMDAARAAHAPGGTVIHAKGTGAEKAEKFFGVSLAKEKEGDLHGDQEGRKKRHHDEYHGKGRPGYQGQGHRNSPFPVTETRACG